MYLTLLNEKEKEAFLGLAYNLAAADGNYSDEEKDVISGYCEEMQYKFDEKSMVKSTDTLLNMVNANSSEKTKKIIIFELVGLAMADNNYDEDERALISLMEKKFSIDIGYANKCEEELNKYIEFQQKLNQIVIG